jgi:hypothetical protein
MRRNRLAALVTFLGAAAITTFAGMSPAKADPTQDGAWVHFHNDGWYYGYMDLWAYDANDQLIGGFPGDPGHYWTGSLGHGGDGWILVPAGTRKVHWMARADGAPGEIHDQWLAWGNVYPANCRPTVYVGGWIGSFNSYDMFCPR